MARMVIRNASTSKAKHRNHKIKCVGGVRLPKEFLVIWHNQLENKLVIKHQSAVDAGDCQQPNNLVTAVNLSEVAVYFCFLPPHEQLNAYTQLIDLVVKTSRTAIMERGGNIIPTELKQIYLRAINFFKGLSAGGIVTEMFVKRISKLVMTIWKHGQNYLDYCRNHGPGTARDLSPLEPATLYVC